MIRTWASEASGDRASVQEPMLGAELVYVAAPQTTKRKSCSDGLQGTLGRYSNW